MRLNWDKAENGLLPAIVQDAESGRVLMLGYVNQESLAATQRTGKVTFFSRSRQSLWVKGETSGNTLHVVELSADCDSDALLIKARPDGPTCHTGTQSCFDGPHDFLAELEEIITERQGRPAAESYVAKLLGGGLDRVAQKVGEEAVETVIAAKNEDLEAFEGEAADLLFHLTLLLRKRGSSLSRLCAVLQRRHAKRVAASP